LWAGWALQTYFTLRTNRANSAVFTRWALRTGGALWTNRALWAGQWRIYQRFAKWEDTHILYLAAQVILETDAVGQCQLDLFVGGVGQHKQSGAIKVAKPSGFAEAGDFGTHTAIGNCVREQDCAIGRGSQAGVVFDKGGQVIGHFVLAGDAQIAARVGAVYDAPDAKLIAIQIVLLQALVYRPTDGDLDFVRDHTAEAERFTREGQTAIEAETTDADLGFGAGRQHDDDWLAGFLGWGGEWSGVRVCN
jgi:hypothetical protein